MPNKINAIKIKNNLICLEAKGPISKNTSRTRSLITSKVIKEAIL